MAGCCLYKLILRMILGRGVLHYIDKWRLVIKDCFMCHGMVPIELVDALWKGMGWMRARITERNRLIESW